jgi:hypothetical protein
MFLNDIGAAGESGKISPPGSKSSRSTKQGRVSESFVKEKLTRRLARLRSKYRFQK